MAAPDGLAGAPSRHATAAELGLMVGTPPPPERRVPREAWQVGPWNRWAYQHVRELLPTALVSRGAGPAWELPARPADLAGIAFDRGNGTRTTLERYLDASWTDGIAVIHGGALVFEAWRNGMTPESRHLSQSVAKSVLGLTTGALAATGALELSARVGGVVPEMAASGYAEATLQHLLDMTAAVDFVEDYAGDFWKYDIACGWHPPRPEAPAGSLTAYLPRIGRAPWAHGERFHYTSPNTDLLGIVVARAAGRPLPNVIAELLWTPLGAERDADLAVDPIGTAVPSGGFCATLRDYARVGRLVLDGGAAAGRQVVPEAFIRTLGAGDPGAVARSPAYVGEPHGTAYRNFWWGIDGHVFARGIHGQRVAVDRDADLVVAILSSWPDAEDPVEEAAQRALVGALAAELR